jgi:DNA polymerase-3 subunit delta'
VDFLRAEALPWQSEWRRRLRASRESGRLPHSSLLLSSPGLGALHLANWMAALALCDSAVAAPCGACTSCALLRSDSHPDYHVIRPEEDAKQIKVEQIRELIAALSLTSYRGGFKAAIIDGAEALNANGANAFLKTLEEPAPDTLLILSARWTHRLPATIASRCLRIALQPPSRDAALSWLEAHGGSAQNWSAALALAGGAPLLAAELDAGVIAELDRDLRADLKQIAAGATDVTLLADRWVRSNLPLRILWFENWITARVHACLGEAAGHHTAQGARLPAELLKPNIRGLFELLDALKELRRAASTGINQQLALEALLVGGRAALANEAFVRSPDHCEVRATNPAC